MIRLHQYPAAWRLPSLSPFCIKVEAYLRMSGLPFETMIENNPLKGPRGRMPFIEEGDRIISDSKLIIPSKIKYRFTLMKSAIVL